MAIENGAGVVPARSAPFERFAGAIFAGAAGFLCAVAYSEEAIAATISYRERVHAHHQPGIELARESIRGRLPPQPRFRDGGGGEGFGGLTAPGVDPSSFDRPPGSGLEGVSSPTSAKGAESLSGMIISPRRERIARRRMARRYGEVELIVPPGRPREVTSMVEPEESREFSGEEVRLALRNPGMHLEGLRQPITPVGMHYLLIHFDIPFVDAATYELPISGRVRDPIRLTLEEIKSRPAVTMPVTMECAGNGRALLSPRPVSAPWHEEAVGCAEWTGTPLRPILEEAGLLDDAVEVLFTGHDRGVDRGVEQYYERSLPPEEALGDGVLLAYGMNGAPLPPQHGAPLRLVVPEWYGMASVKWLKGITAIDKPFEGVQQTQLYRYRRAEDDPGEPVARQHPHALMAPPGIPDFLTRERRVEVGRVLVEGKAWSGFGPVERVEFSADGGRNWADATLDEPLGPYAWVHWSCAWDARPGEHELRVRATDGTGRTQPLGAEETWNLGGYGVNVAQRVRVSAG